MHVVTVKFNLNNIMDDIFRQNLILYASKRLEL